ncbi:beta-ketoacyl-[acyl-carrier-protein] synthase family protein [Streptomyces sp. ITFR-16]|uniref:beta-ketoacyl-[acyl-carrier-protein] synthase family protein n=1 Tax=Streptomyces sp. ITFR-16 TaxID=3075198 RepID=UPI00288B92CD|nr:beta-ketoacyl-[acyl-carrier-protein] synthase family protein [Streptomyces sp. ITFR-16]WNI27277.1 beta-ketoacyl-[acyl-carrier-protein] synthase family protein [Streptomyces sp. ITFR-16]
MPPTPQTVVTGLGIVSSGGTGTDATWQSLLAGRPTARAMPLTAEQTPLPTCRVPDHDSARRVSGAWARRTDRYSQLAFTAADEALAAARLDPGCWEPTRVAVVMGTALAGVATLQSQITHQIRGRKVSPLTIPMFAPNMLPGQLALRLNATGPNLAVATACASGATAIGIAAQMIDAGTCDIALAGGSEAPIAPVVTAAFTRMNALAAPRADPGAASRPFDADRDGFVLGEGAAVLVLEHSVHAAARKATVLARLAGFGATADSHHITDPHPDGAGLSQAIAIALRQAGASPLDVDHVNAHATGTLKGDAIEAALLERLFGRHATVTAPKGTLGHTLGAAGAIEAALTVRAVAEQQVPPTANLDRPDFDLDFVTGTPRSQRIRLALTNSSGFGGQNTALAFTSS